MDKRRVVITGLGCVTPLAESAEDLFSALQQGKSGISTIDSFDVSEYPVRFGGQIKNFNVTKYVGQRESKRMDRFTQFAMAAAIQAVKDSGLDFAGGDPFRAGVIVGTGIGGLKEIEEQHTRLLTKGPRKVSPFCVPRLMGNAASGNIAIKYGLRGPNICVVSACASGSHAIGEAYSNIVTGRSDIMITGGSEAALTPIGLASFCSAKSLSTRNDDPQAASRPFDKDRDGFVLAEGAGVLVLEEYEHAKKRGANIYAELLGYAATDDGYHITAPLLDGAGAAKAMELALVDAGIGKEKVDYINAHGTGTELNDLAESTAIKNVFGDHVYKLLVSSTKSCLGHSLGATGAVELLICCKAITKSVVPPTINLDNPDERCGLKIDYVPLEAREHQVNVAVSNSLGFGGHNSCLVVGKV
ncbi:MAG: beta-ketoacyl-ACP synthase II [Sedimentisphaerales bacterium]|jgi:3-oxoacyl-[acyl-carrier-protein] synthase II|nr:beta-ketoacyl-ACP synthase II [Sedimentisphaerales bacterium]